jgi:hypothetical protein
LAAASPVPVPRRLLVVSGLQIVNAGKMAEWSKKQVFFRNPPYTAVSPTKAQLQIRRTLTEIGKQFKGVKGKHISKRLGIALPGAAAAVADLMYKKTSPFTVGKITPRHYHTGEEIIEMAKEATAEALVKAEDVTAWKKEKGLA